MVDDLAEIWGQRLNARHGLNRPTLFWHRYLLIWLSLSVMATWARWRNMEMLIERHGATPLNVPTVPTDRSWAIPGVPAFVNFVNFDSAFQHWIDSLIARALLPSAWRCVETATNDDNTVLRRATSNPPRDHAPGLGRLARSLIPRLLLDELPGIGAAKLPLSALIALFPRRGAWIPPASSRGGERFVFPSAYLSLLDDFLAQTIPDSIGGASFLEMDARASRLRFRPGRLFVANTRSVNDSHRLVAAHALIAGERLVNAQHGGWEGTAACVAWNTHIYAQDFAFLTWGWKGQAGLAGRFAPFVAPQLAAVRNRHRSRDASLIMVGTRMPLNGMRFDCVPRPRRMIAYRAEKQLFLAGLSNDIRAKVRYRPYTRGPSDLEDESYFMQSSPDLRLVDRDLNGALLRCRLLVLDHPGTTLHLALAAGVPMVCFWNRDDWPLCAEAKPWFDRLEASGVLFRDAAAAAQGVNRIWPDVAAWWRGADVTAAIRECQQRYALTGPWTRPRLVRTLWRLSQMACDTAGPEHMAARPNEADATSSGDL
jgi:putative transferase (TIGR04331 family)